MDIQNVVRHFKSKFTELGNPERAVQEKRYLKSPFKFYGVSVPKIRKLVKEFKKDNRGISKEELWSLCGVLWGGGYHEERAMAVRLLQEYDSCLDYSDMQKLENMLRESVNWDQVDEISAHLVGEVIRKDDKALEFLKKWSKDENFWVRRASLLSQLVLLRNGGGNKELFFSFAKEMLHEKEFFIRKAIGWALRDMSKKDPESVFAFIKANKEKMSKLTFKEGSRQLPLQLQEKL